MEYSLGELSRKTGVDIQKLRGWIRNGYLINFERKPHGGDKIMRYVFTNKHISQVRRVIELRAAGYSLGSAWLIVERDMDRQSLDKLMEE